MGLEIWVYAGLTKAKNAEVDRDGHRTLNGARVGDLFMSLIHTAELCGAKSFDP